ncbi:hypothetical protein Anapl_11493 [Anas platyrhynchos]|uniref:Uncharacterized protein n=1 Tax=Anas platyrhynchos TaxID=8839 RepID=R0JI27_ANAPL|nr:hypothetical protein Anapl_11493 [Anas platyrhynchos]
MSLALAQVDEGVTLTELRAVPTCNHVKLKRRERHSPCLLSTAEERDNPTQEAHGLCGVGRPEFWNASGFVELLLISILSTVMPAAVTQPCQPVSPAMQEREREKKKGGSEAEIQISADIKCLQLRSKTGKTRLTEQVHYKHLEMN